MLLTEFKSFMWAMPKTITRSRLFAPVAKERKKIHDREIVLETTTLNILFCVCQLDEAQVVFFFFQAEDGIRDDLVMEFRRVLFRSKQQPVIERRRVVHAVGVSNKSIGQAT